MFNVDTFIFPFQRFDISIFEKAFLVSFIQNQQNTAGKIDVFMYLLLFLSCFSGHFWSGYLVLLILAVKRNGRTTKSDLKCQELRLEYKFFMTLLLFLSCFSGHFWSNFVVLLLLLTARRTRKADQKCPEKQDKKSKRDMKIYI